MKFITRIPTHDNAGVAFDQELLDAVVLEVAIRFGGFTLSDPSRGGWIDPLSGQLYDEPARTLEAVRQFRTAKEKTNMTTKKNEDFERRCKQLLAFAKQLHRTNPSWTEFQNGVFGVSGPFVRLFPDQSDRKAFLKTDEHAAIRKLIPALTGNEEDNSELPSGKFVVRVPRSMHSALQKEASEEGVSLNQLVVAKLAIGLGQHTVLSS